MYKWTSFTHRCSIDGPILFLSESNTEPSPLCHRQCRARSPRLTLAHPCPMCVTLSWELLSDICLSQSQCCDMSWAQEPSPLKEYIFLSEICSSQLLRPGCQHNSPVTHYVSIQRNTMRGAGGATKKQPGPALAPKDWICQRNPP
jgi:hypothetical protein